jgi:hypothetical protein
MKRPIIKARRKIMPLNQCLEYEAPANDSRMVWESFSEGGVFVTREEGKPFTFATGQEATIKLDAERLAVHPEIIDRLLGLYALHPCVTEADALSYVPNGMADFADKLGRRIGKQVIKLVRPDGAPRTDIRYVGPDDEALAREVSSVCAVEDISRTGFSAHATARVLREANPGLDVHTLSMMQRDAVDLVYETDPGGVTYHTFVREDIPLSLEEFQQQFPDIAVATVA